MLVGGGELHDRWETLCAVRAPLSRGIQRFTGITPGDGRRRAAGRDHAARAGRADGRPRARRPQRAASTAACCARRSTRAGLRWPDPPVLCTVALARRLHPLAAPARAAPAGRVAGHRGRGRRTARWPTPRRARACSARCSRGCAPTRSTVGRGAGAAAPARGAPRRCGRDARRRVAPRAAPAPCPTSASCPTSPASTSFRNAEGQVALRRQVDRRAHARAGALRRRRRRRARGRAGRDRRLPRRRLRARRAGARAPADPAAAAAGQRAAQARRPARLPALPARHPVPGPGGRARAGGGARGLDRARCAAARRPSSSSSSSTRCSGCATAGAGCRGASGRRPTGRWAAACRRAWATWTPTSTAGGSTRRWRCSPASGDGARRRCLAHVDAEMRAAAAEQRFERAAWLRRRRARLAELLAASAARSPRRTRGRGWCWRAHPREARASTRFWLVGGRVVDWGPLDRGRRMGAHRSAALRGGGPAATTSVPPDEVDEVRLVTTWMEAHRPPTMVLDGRGRSRSRRSSPGTRGPPRPPRRRSSLTRRFVGATAAGAGRAPRA